jgi:hypothetical protein
MPSKLYGKDRLALKSDDRDIPMAKGERIQANLKILEIIEEFLD